MPVELDTEKQGSMLEPVPFPSWAEGDGHENLTLFQILSYHRGHLRDKGSYWEDGHRFRGLERRTKRLAITGNGRKSFGVEPLQKQDSDHSAPCLQHRVHSDACPLCPQQHGV